MTLNLATDTTRFQAPSNEKDVSYLLGCISHETDPLTLRRLEEQYNLLAGLHKKGRNGLLLDPIEVFPPEIWLQILGYVTLSDSEDEKEDINPSDSLFLASLVSPRWRDVILNTPDFWSEIVVVSVSDSYPDELFKLHAALSLSRQTPLNLTIKGSFPKNWDILQLLSRHRGRFQTISLSGSWDSPDIEGNINRFFLSMGPMPRLQVVHSVKELIWSYLDWDMLLPNAPSLVSINFVPPPEVLGRAVMKNFHTVSVYDRFDDVFPHVLRLKSLKCLSWWAGTVYDPNSIVSLPEIHLSNFQNLEELNYYRLIVPPVLDILEASFKLNTLSINVGSRWDILARLFEACRISTVLSTLDIRLEDPAKSKGYTITPPAGPLTARSLSIRYFPSTILPHERSVKSACAYLADLVDILERCTPFVQEFYFYAGVLDYIPFKFISSRRYLFRLTLSLPALTLIPPNTRIQSESLITLNVKIIPSLVSEFCLGLNCPNLYRTTFPADDKYSRSLSSPEVQFGPMAFSQLVSLEWRNRPIHWNVTSLPALRKLLLGGLAGEMATELCIHFIMRPHDCPSLEFIDFGINPEWDLLFLMLERRNHSTQYGVSKIETLVFPTAIPYSLLLPVTELLGGRFVPELSYRDFSISSIADVFFDENMWVCPPALDPTSLIIFQNHPDQDVPLACFRCTAVRGQ